jgi:S1 RNA binding domain protein
MALEVGSIVEGRVTGITKFGAFVALPDGKSGLVHISEIANSFVSDVHEFVEMGQTVKVRVLSISEEGKVNLSIKRALEEAPRPERSHAPNAPKTQARPAPAPRPVGRTEADGPSNDMAFEERLKKFMQDADSRMADKRQYFEHKSRNRRR